jgi:hypothetical protein
LNLLAQLRTDSRSVKCAEQISVHNGATSLLSCANRTRSICLHGSPMLHGY